MGIKYKPMSTPLHMKRSEKTALFKDYSDSLGGVYGSRLKPNEVTTQMMAVEGCLSAGIPLHALGNSVFRDFLHHEGVKLPAAGNLSNYINFIEKRPNQGVGLPQVRNRGRKYWVFLDRGRSSLYCCAVDYTLVILRYGFSSLFLIYSSSIVAV